MKIEKKKIEKEVNTTTADLAKKSEEKVLTKKFKRKKLKKDHVLPGRKSEAPHNSR